MFNVHPLKEIPFLSNPDLGEDYKVELSTNDYGSPVNKVVVVPKSNKPFYEGAKYDPATMSLRAKLNCGVDLQRVSFGATENDPNVIMSYALKFESTLQERFEYYHGLSQKQASSLAEDVKSNTAEDVKSE